MGVSRTIPLLAALFLAILSLSASAQSSSPTCTTTAITISPSPLFSVLALAFMLSFLVVAIGVVISKAVPNTNLNEWLKNEYWEMAKSAILIAGSVGFIIFAGNISLLLINQQPVSQYGFAGIGSALNSLSTASSQALCSVYSNINALGNSGSTNFFNLVEGIGVMKSINIGWYVPLPLIVGAFTFGTTFNIYSNPMLESTASGQYESILNDTLNYLYLPVMLIIYLLGITLPSIIYIGMMILVPLGIILRAFPFLRPIGGTLFAFGIGLSLFLPLLIILINMPVSNILYNVMTTNMGVSTSSQGASGIIGVLLNGLASIWNAALNGLVNIGTVVGATISIYPALNVVVPFFVFLFGELALLILDLMIWYPLTDSLAKALGGTIRLDIGGKLKIG
ncbi:MAG: hypothetical protein ACP5HW_01835 [Candidatus Micrarchaeia archaeon]